MRDRVTLLVLLPPLVLAGTIACQLPAERETPKACGCSKTLPADDGPAELSLPLLPPGSGPTIALVQHLTVTLPNGGGENMPMDFDALVDFGPDASQLVILMGGMRVLKARWDGQRLTEERGPRLPAEVSARRILAEAQLAWWPVEAVRAGLPQEAFIRESPSARVLIIDDRIVVEIAYPADGPRFVGMTTFANHLTGYRLTIQSARASPAQTAP